MLRLIGNDAIARHTAIKAVFIRRGGAACTPRLLQVWLPPVASKPPLFNVME